jgi:homocitrate synthase NifV
MRRKISICDTTLRDGEQTPGVAFTVQEKCSIARMLDNLGVQEIECGTPAMGREEQHAVAGILDLGLAARIITWNRAVISDIEDSIRCGATAVAVSLPVSDFHITNKLKKSRGWVLAQLSRAVSFAKDHNLYVCAGAEDASRGDMEFLAEFGHRAKDYGADRLRFSDTLGWLDPFQVSEKVSYLVSEVGLPVEIHTHNDFGMATANALAGIKSGATFVSTSVLGLGERAGNAALEEVVMALKHVLGLDLGLRVSGLLEICRYVSEASGRAISPAKPIVGTKIFSHESEIHADGVLKNPANYEPFSPEEVGLAREISLGKHSGKRAVAFRLRRLGIVKEKNEVAEMVRKIRSSHAKGALTDADLVRLC